MEPGHVFVYGSLKRGFRLNHNYLAECEFAGEGTLKGYTLHKVRGAWYPGVWPGEGGIVRGEVFETDRERMAVLDGVEDEGRLYDRAVEEIHMDSGEVLKAYVYVYRDKEKLGPVIENGVWEVS